MSRSFAVEDASLNVRSIVTSRSRLFSDIDLTMAVKPSGDVYKKSDAAAVKQAVINLLQTNRCEKPFLPLYGGNLRSMLFELADQGIAEELNTAIRRAIEAYEPRVDVLSVVSVVRPDYNSVGVTVEMRVQNMNDVIVFQTNLTKLR